MLFLAVEAYYYYIYHSKLAFLKWNNRGQNQMKHYKTKWNTIFITALFSPYPLFHNVDDRTMP